MLGETWRGPRRGGGWLEGKASDEDMREAESVESMRGSKVLCMRLRYLLFMVSGFRACT
jgi:hypothetical protein